MQLEGEFVFEEEIEDLLPGLYRDTGEGADEPDREAVGLRDLVSPHGPLEVPLRSLEIVQVPRPVDAGPDGDVVLREDIGELRCHPPEVRLEGEFRLQVGKALRAKREGLPVEIGPGNEGFPSMDGEGAPVSAEILQPSNDLPRRFDAHDGGSFL